MSMSKGHMSLRVFLASRNVMWVYKVELNDRDSNAKIWLQRDVLFKTAWF